MKQPLIILAGPTAVGKTGLSIALAKALDGEIISADSMQVYRGMDIGTAKIRPEEMQGIPHHLIDILEPQEEFNVVSFAKRGKKAISEIAARGKLPIVVGGTGFYIQALLYEIDFTDTDEDKSYRRTLERLADTEGAAALHRLLQKVDPKAAAEIHPNNRKRVIRALEFYEKSGKRISEHNEEQRQKSSPYQACFFVLTDDRKRLYERIDQRVERMLAEGLIEEVAGLMQEGCTRSMVSMQGLGYQEIAAYLDGEIPLEDAIYLIKRDTRHFAKRQLTWFKREPEVVWVDRQTFHDSDQEILSFLLETIKERQSKEAGEEIR